MTRGWQIFTGVGLAIFGLLTVVGLFMALDGLSKNDSATLTKGLLASAGMGCVAAYLGVNFYAREKGGYVAVGPDGVFLDTFLSIGFIPWNNLKAVAVVDMGNQSEVVAVCLNDPAAFIATRGTATGEMSTAFRYYNAVMRAAFEANSYTLAWLIKPARVVEKIIGTKYIPQSGEEIHLMESNRQVTGYHILIPSYWFDKPRDVVAFITASNPTR